MYKCLSGFLRRTHRHLYYYTQAVSTPLDKIFEWHKKIAVGFVTDYSINTRLYYL